MNKKQLKTIIITCWALLGICFIIKLFGGNWFELSTENQRFINFCNMVDNTMWLKMILALFLCLFSTYFFICLLLNKEKLNLKEILLFGILTAIKSIVSWYIDWLPIVLDCFILVLIPLILCKFKNWKRIIIVNVLVVCFQFISVIIRNMSFLFVGNSFIEQTLMQIDYYILLFIYYLYNRRYFIKKEV